MGCCTVLCAMWEEVVLVRIVLKTRIGLYACGVSSNAGFQYNTDSCSVFPYCAWHCIVTYYY